MDSLRQKKDQNNLKKQAKLSKRERGQQARKVAAQKRQEPCDVEEKRLEETVVENEDCRNNADAASFIMD